MYCTHNVTYVRSGGRIVTLCTRCDRMIGVNEHTYMHRIVFGALTYDFHEDIRICLHHINEKP